MGEFNILLTEFNTAKSNNYIKAMVEREFSSLAEKITALFALILNSHRSEYMEDYVVEENGKKIWKSKPKQVPRFKLYLQDLYAFLGIPRGGNSIKQIEKALDELEDTNHSLIYENIKKERVKLKWLSSYVPIEEEIGNKKRKAYIFTIENVALNSLYVFDSHGFTYIQHLYSLSLKFKHSQKMYEVIMANNYDNKNPGGRIHQYHINDIRNWLGLKNKYKSNYEFQRNVINKFVDDINENTPLDLKIISFAGDLLQLLVSSINDVASKAEQLNEKLRKNPKIKELLSTFLSMKESSEYNYTDIEVSTIQQEKIEIEGKIGTTKILQLENSTDIAEE